MFGIGASELLVILVAALIIFGPARLPEMGRMVGKALAEMRRATQEIQDQIHLDIEDPPVPRRPSQASDREPAAQAEEPGDPAPDEVQDDSLAELTLQAAEQHHKPDEDTKT